jgi:hypothetical protein
MSRAVFVVWARGGKRRETTVGGAKTRYAAQAEYIRWVAQA